MGFKKKHYRQQVDERLRCCSFGHGLWLLWLILFFKLACGEKAKTTADGTTALGLVKVAEELGFETRAFRAGQCTFGLEGDDLSINRPRDQDVSLIIT